ncbi:MAG TPA: DNA recombination protein RmuC [Gemmatales bacterium]|nr:DNA recombination protein RmuC [Gemmatales bacterium]HMP58988.1 DNA recombination protein RmuC [Gemmatales bacterium]
MELLITFAVGMAAGAGIGVALTVVVVWTKEKIDRQRTFDEFVAELRETTEGVRTLLTDDMGDRRQTFGTMIEQLHNSARQTTDLMNVTQALSNALSHPTIRGQWGERMVEDVLRPAGFQEGINYEKQATMANTSNRPDYTFLLPRGLKVNLDAKFPLDNYLAYYKATSQAEQQEYKKRFLSDVRSRIKEVVNRGYISPDDNTVDCVLVFIPNEQVFSFINAVDSKLFDDAIRDRVVLCSPWTLYPVLAIIRAAVDNFILEKTTAELLPLMRKFDSQWEEFNKAIGRMGKKIDEAQKECRQLLDSRSSQFEKVLAQISAIRNPKDFNSVGSSSGVAADPSTDRAAGKRTAGPGGGDADGGPG